MAGVKIKDATLVNLENLSGEADVPISINSGVANRAKLKDIRGINVVGSGLTFRVGSKTYILRGAEEVSIPSTPALTGSSVAYKSLTVGVNSVSGATLYYVVTSSTDENDPATPDASTITTSSSHGTIVLNQDTDYEYKKYKVVAKYYKDGVWSEVSEVFSTTVYRKLDDVSVAISGNIYNTTRVVTLAQSQGATIYYKKSADSDFTEYTVPIELSATDTLTIKATKSTWEYSQITREVKVGVLKIYYGLVNSAPTMTSAIEALTAVAPTDGPTDATLNAGVTTSQFSGVGAICFAYPATLRDLTSIKDNSNAEYISDFIKTTVGGYKVYTMESALVDQTGLSYTFK